MLGSVEQGRPVASVVIPAHNEASNILTCLRTVTEFGQTVPLEVIVAANGCTDRTVELARSLSGVRVLDLPVASKVQTLNAADQIATCFPRIYLDADVQLDQEALRCLIETLTTDRPRLAVPSVRYDLGAADCLVRRFYQIFQQLPAAQKGTTGRGVYAVSGAGRARFGRFPNVLGDDLFVNRLFSTDETVVCRGLSVVRTPATWRDLVRIRSRLAAGNAELAAATEDEMTAAAPDHDFSRTTSATVVALFTLIGRRPHQLPSVLVYAVLTGLARMRGEPRGWERDQSTR